MSDEYLIKRTDGEWFDLRGQLAECFLLSTQHFAGRAGFARGVADVARGLPAGPVDQSIFPINPIKA